MELLERIEAFSFDEPGTSFTFAQRLARENGWSGTFTRRVLREYGRFTFLAMTAGHPVCPSESVDQAWHQHLTFTQNYWEDYCGKVLGAPLHHGPTRGGSKEEVKHHDMYARTLASYREAFNEEPPSDIWEPAIIRFGDGGSYVRVNRRDAWIIRKPRWLRQAAMVAFALGSPCLMGAHGALAEIPIFDSTGPDFVLFYAAVIALAAIVIATTRAAWRGPAPTHRTSSSISDPYLIATLTGGSDLALYAAMTELTRRGLMTSAGPESISVVPGANAPADLHPFERAVFGALPKVIGSIKEVRNELSVELKGLRSVLEKEQLVVSDARREGGRRTANRLMGAIILIGVIKLVLGIARYKAVGWLVLLLSVATMLFFVFRRRVPFRTKQGDANLRDLRRRNERFGLWSDIQSQDRTTQGSLLPLAVGLYGFPILSGSPWGFIERNLVPEEERQSKKEEKNNGCSGGCGTGCSVHYASSTSGDSGGSHSCGDGGSSSGGGSSGCSGGSSSGSSGCGGCGGGGGS